ncbi:MAG: peptidyl-prolyl cis-trans isomerase [Acidobacteriota bacterium]
MLDLMRKANRQKWFLGIIVMFVVFSFVVAIFAIWGGAASGGAANDLTWVARVNGIEITARELERQRLQLENLFRSQLGNQFEEIARTQDFYRIAVDQLVNTALASTYAERLGLAATPAEISAYVRSSPQFRSGGRFIGVAQYRNELKRRNRPVTDYERGIARRIRVDKLRDFVGTMVSVTDAEIDEAYKQQGETAEVDYILLEQEDFTPPGDPSTAELGKYFEEHRADYKTPEKRRARYVLIERAPLLESVEISDEEIRAEYDRNRARYHHDEQRRASHILFKIPPGASDEEIETIKQKASSVLEQIRSGRDFAELARQYSEHDSAQNGGDLGWFSRGRMVPEFEKAAFSLNEGEVSDLLRTPYGFHIIKVTGSRPEGEQPFEEVSDQIRQQLAFRRAQDLLQRETDDFAAKLDQQTSSFEATATESGYSVEDTGLFTIDGRLGKLGVQPRATHEAFSLKLNGVSSAISVPEGWLFLQVTEVKPAEPAPFDSVRDQVKQDLNRARAFERARAVGRKIVAAGFDGFKQAADKEKLNLNSIDEFTRASAPYAFNDAIKDAIFSHDAGSVIGPLDADDGVVVVKVIKRSPTTPEETAAVRRRVRDQLIARKQSEAFDALLQGLQRTASIETNDPFWRTLGRRTSS